MRRLSIIHIHTQGSDNPLFGSTCRAPFATYITVWPIVMKIERGPWGNEEAQGGPEQISHGDSWPPMEINAPLL